MTDLGLYFLTSDLFHDTDYVANYRTESKDGKKLKSTTIFIRDENKKIIGFLFRHSYEISNRSALEFSLNRHKNIKLRLIDKGSDIETERLKQNFSFRLIGEIIQRIGGFPL